MSKRIRIKAGQVGLEAELNDSETAKSVLAALPIKARAQLWGEEIYFAIPVEHGEENAREVVESGDIGFWPPGSAMCFFFGKTPASRGDEIRPASAVNVIGRIKGDPKLLKSVQAGEPVEVELME